MSKFSWDVLQKHVFPFTEASDRDLILGAAFGEDVALTRVGGDILASHVDPIVGAIGDIGWLAVHVACNDIADVGRVTEGVDVRLLREDEAIHYREIRCEEDELARMWALYPRDG